MNAAHAPPARQVPCPRCRQPGLFSSANRWRPFCSERCAQIDLGSWSSERYRVNAPAQTSPDGDLDLDSDATH